jgi:serine/threonine-protein kinase
MNATAPMEGPGDLLAGKYRVERVLGEGGMGVVLAATNEALNQKVAIKLLRQGVLENTEAITRFNREARAAAKLKSEHVARVLDVGVLPDKRQYMVLEMLEGADLSALIDDPRPIDIGIAVDYVLQACEAIAEAHAAGIVHRDLKPKNLFLTKRVDGRDLVKVLDFGISKVEGESAADMQLTRTTEVIGSPSYMSPEQLRSSRNVDVRTDIWALGVILYELITKRLPFYAHTVTELVLVVVSEREPSVKSLRPDVPDALDAVIARCLAKKPEDRFQSVVELAHALEPFAGGAVTSAVDRVRGVAAQSGKSLPAVSSGKLPDTGSSSARINVLGGSTSVAWGETQRETNPPRMSGPPASRPQTRSRAPLAIALAATFVVGVGAAGSGVWYAMKRTGTAHASAPGEAMPLPPGRKDLPPLESASAAPPPVASAPPSALPDTRTLASATPATTAKAKPVRPPAPVAKPDDLSGIGRK